MDFHSRIVRRSLNSLSLSLWVVLKTKDSIDNHRCEKYSFETRYRTPIKPSIDRTVFNLSCVVLLTLVRMREWLFARQTARLQLRCGRAAVAATPCTRPPVTRSNRSGSVRSFLREINGHAFFNFRSVNRRSLPTGRSGWLTILELNSPLWIEFFFFLLLFFSSPRSVLKLFFDGWFELFIFERDFFF